MLISIGGLTLMSGSVGATTNGFCDTDEQTPIGDDESFNELKTEYCDSVENVESSTTDVETDLENFKDGHTDAEEVNQSLQQLESDQQEMKKLENQLKKSIVEKTADGSLVGGFEIIDQLKASSDQTYSEVDEVLEEGGESVIAEYTSVKNTIRLTLFGSLTGGVLLGAIAGAAIPMVKAKKIHNRMSYTADVSIGKKVVIIPSLIGAVLLLIGVAVLVTQLGLGNTIEVII